MKLEYRLRKAERLLFGRHGLKPDESFIDLPTADVRLRVLSTGTGPDLVMLHGVSLAAAVWVPLLCYLPGFRVHLVELPGQGLSGPVHYQVGSVRDHSVHLLDDLFDALGVETAAVVGHSLGGMFALWYAAARPGRITSLVAMGSPAVALAGARVRMPLSLLTVPALGSMVLRSPTPKPLYRRLLGQGLSRAAVAAAPDELVEVLRLAARRKGNAHTVATLMHAIDHVRRPREESVLSDEELGRISIPTMFCWGVDDPFLLPAQARPSIARMPAAVLHEVQGGHAPWFEDPAGCAGLVREHLSMGGIVLAS